MSGSGPGVSDRFGGRFHSVDARDVYADIMLKGTVASVSSITVSSFTSMTIASATSINVATYASISAATLSNANVQTQLLARGGTVSNYSITVDVGTAGTLTFTNSISHIIMGATISAAANQYRIIEIPQFVGQRLTLFVASTTAASTLSFIFKSGDSAVGVVGTGLHSLTSTATTSLADLVAGDILGTISWRLAGSDSTLEAS